MRRGRAPGPGRLWKRDPNWILDYTEADGRRRRVTLGRDKRVAERRRMELIRRRDMQLDGLGAVEGQGLRLSEIKGDYLEDLRGRVSARYYSGTESRLAKVLEELGDPAVRDLRPMALIRVRNGIVTAGKSHRTANLHVDCVRAMLRWAAELGIIASNPVAVMKRLPDVPVSPRRAMTEDEIARFLAASEHDDDQCELIWDYQRVPQTPFWLTLLESGIRYGEARQATWGDLDTKERILVLRPETTKSRRQRVIPLREELVERLIRLKVLHETVYIRLPRACDPIFLSPEGMPWKWPTTNAMRIFHRLLKAAGIRKIDAQGRKLDIHALRVTCASRLARRGVPLVHAQRILGHSSPQITAQHYVDLDLAELREAIDRVPSGTRTEEVRPTTRRA